MDHPDTRAWIEPFQQQLDRVRAAGVLNVKPEIDRLGRELSKLLFDVDQRLRAIEARG
jgi:hypothetical protein